MKTPRFIAAMTLSLLALPFAASPSPTVGVAYDAALTVLPGPHPASGMASLHLGVRIPMLGEQSLLLEPNLHLQGEAERFVEGVAEGRVAFYQGVVVGRESSWVRLTKTPDAWFGLIHDGTTLWLIDPASQHAGLAARTRVAPGSSLIFSLNDVSGMADFHGDMRLPPMTFQADENRHLASDIQGAQTKWLRVSLVLDTEFQARWGSNSNSMAVGILNAVDGFYAQANTRVLLHALQPLSSNGTMTPTDSGDLLDAFSDYSNAGNIPFHGLAHLLSGKDFDGSTVGLAWVGVADPGYVSTVCNRRYGTGINQITSSQALGAVIVAHEMGHNYGASHDGSGNACASSGFIMASGVGSSYNTFSTCSLGAFTAYQTARQPACLADVPPQDQIMFADGFEG